MDYNVPSGIEMLLQDLYTPKGYNPAEYTLLGYDPNMYGSVDPTYSYYNPQAAAPQVMAAQPMSNADIEAIAAQNAANAAPSTPASDYAADYMIYKLNAMGNTGPLPAEGERNVYYPEPSADKRSDMFAAMPISAQLYLQNKADAYAQQRKSGKQISPEEFG